MLSKQHHDIANTLNAIGFELFTNTVDHFILVGLIAGRNFNLDQFVMIDGRFQFIQHIFRQAMLADHDDGLELETMGFGA